MGRGGLPGSAADDLTQADRGMEALPPSRELVFLYRSRRRHRAVVMGSGLRLCKVSSWIPQSQPVSSDKFLPHSARI